MIEEIKSSFDPQELAQWAKLKAELAKLTEAEMTLRKKIFGDCFTNPKEGVNDFPLSNNWVLKGTYKINRSVDEPLLKAKQNELLKAGVPVASLTRQKIELETKNYKALSKEQKVLFDQVLDIKVGAPTLEIVLPKR